MKRVVQVVVAQVGAASPVYWAGASLKPRAVADKKSLSGHFPGLLGRGLIEACVPLRTTAVVLSFPGLLGRGLIEATRRRAGA